MKWSHRMLAVAGLAAASVTVYHLRTQHLERAQAARAATAMVAPQDGAQAAALASMTPGAVPAGEVPPDRSEVMGEANAPAPTRTSGQIAVARHRLERLRDPDSRAARAREAEAGLRALLGEGLEMAPGRKMPGMGLSADQINGVIWTMTELGLQQEERGLECRANPACDLPAFEAEQERFSREQLAILVGEDRLQRYEARVAQWQERELAR